MASCLGYIYRVKYRFTCSSLAISSCVLGRPIRGGQLSCLDLQRTGVYCSLRASKVAHSIASAFTCMPYRWTLRRPDDSYRPCRLQTPKPKSMVLHHTHGAAEQNFPYREGSSRNTLRCYLKARKSGRNHRILQCCVAAASSRFRRSGVTSSTQAILSVSRLPSGKQAQC